MQGLAPIKKIYSIVEAGNLCESAYPKLRSPASFPNSAGINGVSKETGETATGKTSIPGEKY